MRPAQNLLFREVNFLERLWEEAVGVETGVCVCGQILNRPVVRYSSRWKGVDAIESISICISNVEDEETTFLAANSDSWALESQAQ